MLIFEDVFLIFFYLAFECYILPAHPPPPGRRPGGGGWAGRIFQLQIIIQKSKTKRAKIQKLKK